jgi:hypothetical protein
LCDTFRNWHASGEYEDFLTGLSDFSSCPMRGPEGPHYPCKPDTSIAELL